MTDAKISPNDIETKFRDIQGQVDSVAEDGKKKALIGGGVGAVIILLLIYILGQKSGKKKSTVLEIRRL
ncbi:MAG: hypothetical protein ACI8TP_001126 [Acidimicrobiales bacterium]|jgi:hypothetical protein